MKKKTGFFQFLILRTSISRFWKQQTIQLSRNSSELWPLDWVFYTCRKRTWAPRHRHICHPAAMRNSSRRRWFGSVGRRGIREKKTPKETATIAMLSKPAHNKNKRNYYAYSHITRFRAYAKYVQRGLEKFLSIFARQLSFRIQTRGQCKEIISGSPNVENLSTFPKITTDGLWISYWFYRKGEYKLDVNYFCAQ